MMRRLICALLVLMMSLSLACPALAATSSIGNSTPASNPKTGDQIMTYAIIMVVALLALAVVAVISRKVFKK